MVCSPEKFGNYTNVTVQDLLSHKATALPSSLLHVDISSCVPSPHETLQGVNSVQDDQMYRHDFVLQGSLRNCVATNARKVTVCSEIYHVTTHVGHLFILYVIH